MRGGLSATTRARPYAQLICGPDTSKYQDSARTTLAVANNDPVGSWTDKISGANLAQPTSTKRPLLKTAVLNGYDVIQTDGVDDALVTGMLARTSQSWLLVAKKMSAASATAKTLAAIYQSTSARSSIFTNTLVGTGINFTPTEALGSVVGGGTPTSFDIILLSIYSASSAVLWVNGGAGVAFDPNDVLTTSVFFALGQAGNASQFGDFQIAEVRRYYLGLGLGDADNVGVEMANKYALSWAQAS